MNRTTLLALASRVEAMRGPTCVVDVEIAIAVGYAGENSEGARDIRADPDEDGWLLFAMAGEPCECCNRAPPYTASLDAAMSLVPSDAYWRLGHDGDGADPAEYKADVIVPKLGGVDARGRAIAVTPPLALTAACLRARAIAGSMTDD